MLGVEKIRPIPQYGQKPVLAKPSIGMRCSMDIKRQLIGHHAIYGRKVKKLSLTVCRT